MKKECNVCWMAALGGIGVAFLGFGLLTHGWPGSATGAAWVQAIGSLVALVVVYMSGKAQAESTIEAVTHSHVLSAQARRQNAVAAATAGVGMIKECLSAIELAEADSLNVGTRVALAADSRVGGFIAYGESLSATLRSFDMSQLTEPEAVRRYVEFSHAFAIAVWRSHNAVQPLWHDEVIANYLESMQQRERIVSINRMEDIRVRNLKESLNVAVEHYEKLQAILNSDGNRNVP